MGLLNNWLRPGELPKPSGARHNLPAPKKPNAPTLPTNRYGETKHSRKCYEVNGGDFDNPRDWPADFRRCRKNPTRGCAAEGVRRIMERGFDVHFLSTPWQTGPWRHIAYPQPWNASKLPTWADGLADAFDAEVTS